MISQLNGGAPKPAFVPPRPFEKGAHGRPTLVQNVETLAHVALIARFGAGWFRELGPRRPGRPRVPGRDRRPGPRSSPSAARSTGPGSTRSRSACPSASWSAGPAARPSALRRSWPAGTSAAGCRTTRRSASRSAIPRSAPRAPPSGSGVLVLLPESACGLAETAWIAGFLATQSAGQCGPCANGLPALAGLLEQLAFGRPDRQALGWAERLVTLVARRGACHLPDGTAAFVASALTDLRRRGAPARRGRAVLPGAAQAAAARPRLRLGTAMSRSLPPCRH